MSRAQRNGEVDPERGVFMISVAAELANMHPQTLRISESRGLITPKRSAKGTRLYSWADVERLRRIQEMTAELGMNLAGVEKVLQLEQQLERMSRRLEQVERRAERMREQFARDARELEGELERVRDEAELARARAEAALGSVPGRGRGELVRYRPPGTALVRVRAMAVRPPLVGDPTQRYNLSQPD